MFAYLALSRPRACPSLGWPSRLLGQPLGFLGPHGSEKRFSGPYPLRGERVRSAREGEPSGAILVGKDRHRRRVSRDVMWRHVMAGSEIEADSCASRIRRPYKTTRFAPRVPYFASSPSCPQPPPPIARASRTRIAATVKLVSASQPPLNSHPPPPNHFNGVVMRI